MSTASIRAPLLALVAVMVGGHIALASCVSDVTLARVGGDGAIDGGSEAAPADTGIVCPQVDGAAFMVQVGDFCIDSTEVTRRQYKVWLDTRPDPRNQDFRCDWNQSSDFSPGPGQPGDRCNAAARNLVDAPDLPVVCINWCDAFTYCKAQGKRLCGAIGGGADAPPYGPGAVLVNDGTSSQWYAACAGNPPHPYPYGDAAVSDVCHGSELDGDAASPTGSLGNCHGKSGTPYGAIYDLSGNVAEWTDACTAGSAWALTNCLARGGCFLFPARTNSCLFDEMAGLIRPTRSHVDDHIGFRCCAP